jgi:ActR/RegA family two-component response regulator
LDCDIHEFAPEGRVVIPAVPHLRGVPTEPGTVLPLSRPGPDGRSQPMRRAYPRSPRVLLVDDVPGEAVNFYDAFGSGLTAVRTVEDLEQRLADGESWDFAFIDFNLSLRSETGLTAMLSLRSVRPETRLVTYSQLAENGRVLFAAAARHWLGARAILDKSQNDPATLRRYVTAMTAGLDPSPVQWRNRMHRAYLIDGVLPDELWVDRWRALDRASGDVTIAAQLLNLKAAHLRGFKDRATSAVNQFNEAFFDIPNRGPSRNKKGILGTFVARHTSFLTAPDLPRLLAHRDAESAAR